MSLPLYLECVQQYVLMPQMARLQLGGITQLLLDPSSSHNAIMFSEQISRWGRMSDLVSRALKAGRKDSRRLSFPPVDNPLLPRAQQRLA